MRVGVYAPKAPHDPQSAARPGRALHRDRRPGHVREGRRAARRSRPGDVIFVEAGRHAPVRGVRRRLRDLGGVLGPRGRRARREAAHGARAPASGITLPSPFWLVDRVLYRDGLILIIDKPAGVPVHAGLGRRRQSRALFRGAALRPAAAAGAGPPAGPRHQRLPRARAATARRWPALGRLFAGGQVEKVYWAVVRGRPPAGGGHGRAGAAQALRGARLVDGGRSGGPGGASPTTACWAKATASAGWSAGRAPAAPTRSASTAPSSAARCWATRSTAAPDARRRRRCTCTPASIALPLYPNRAAGRRHRRHRRRTCWRPCADAAM